jgi:hypothetical protein
MKLLWQLQVHRGCLYLTFASSCNNCVFFKTKLQSAGEICIDTSFSVWRTQHLLYVALFILGGVMAVARDGTRLEYKHRFVWPLNLIGGRNFEGFGFDYRDVYIVLL